MTNCRGNKNREQSHTSPSERENFSPIPTFFPVDEISSVESCITLNPWEPQHEGRLVSPRRGGDKNPGGRAKLLTKQQTIEVGNDDQEYCKCDPVHWHGNNSCLNNHRDENQIGNGNRGLSIDAFDSNANLAEALAVLELGTDDPKSKEENHVVDIKKLNSVRCNWPTLQNELTCAICLEYFDLPVTMRCSHTFCRYCITHDRLIGGTCPLCREPLDGDYSVNKAIGRLLEALKLNPPFPTIENNRAATMNKEWWDTSFAKSHVPISLFLRVFYGEKQTSPLLLDDTIQIIRERFNQGQLWSTAEWILTFEDAQKLAKMANLYSKTEAGKAEQLAAWVTAVTRNSPKIAGRGLKRRAYHIEICVDRAHKIQGTFVDTSKIKHYLPWDVGRHTRSLVQLPHASVSACHLLFVPGSNSENLAVLECGSTIGTMIRIENLLPIEGEVVIHLGDRVEVILKTQTNTSSKKQQNFYWDKSQNVVCSIDVGEEFLQQLQPPSPSYNSLGSKETCLSKDDPILQNYSKIVNTCTATYRNANSEMMTVTLDPRGTVLGRGPFSQQSFKKIGVTTTNGYVSRDHCLVFYGMGPENSPGWHVKDISMLGTYLRLSQFALFDNLSNNAVIKVGQCRMLIKSHLHSDTLTDLPTRDPTYEALFEIDIARSGNARLAH